MVFWWKDQEFFRKGIFFLQFLSKNIFVRDGGLGLADRYLWDLNDQLKKLLLSMPGLQSPQREWEAEDQPTVWVSKLVDYRDKYSFSLNDGSIGM